MAYTTINKGSSYFTPKLYTGNGSATQAITGVGFKPDLVWVKNRTAAVSHCWVDVVRAAPNQLGSDLTDAENTSGNNYAVYGGVSVLGTDGFTVSLGSDPTYQATNKSAQNYVAWNWLASNTTTSNTAGSITSTVSANPTAGFSIVSYTGTGATATVGHGLGVTPKMLIVKKRDTGGTDWTVWGSVLGGTVGSEKITLNGTGAKSTGLNSSWFNNTAPTSTLFTIGTQSDLNGSGGTYIGYCFAEVKGYSKFSSYIGNGSTDGTFVYTGFKPAMIITKANAVADWFIRDNKQNSYNVMNEYLSPNTTATSGNLNSFDFVSNGFKIRNDNNAWNGSGTTYYYMAFAENPFVSSTLVPTTAR